MRPELELLTEDHPTANGRTPQAGDKEYALRFPLEDGRELVIRMGGQGFETLTQLLMDMLAGVPSYNDGTTNIGKKPL
jgi:hypothetical protein